jgi:hypothetical protein
MQKYRDLEQVGNISKIFIWNQRRWDSIKLIAIPTLSLGFSVNYGHHSMRNIKMNTMIPKPRFRKMSQIGGIVSSPTILKKCLTNFQQGVHPLCAQQIRKSRHLFYICYLFLFYLFAKSGIIFIVLKKWACFLSQQFSRFTAYFQFNRVFTSLGACLHYYKWKLTVSLHCYVCNTNVAKIVKTILDRCNFREIISGSQPVVHWGTLRGRYMRTFLKFKFRRKF